METLKKDINEITIEDLNTIINSQLLAGHVEILVLEKFHKNELGVYVARGYAAIYEVTGIHNEVYRRLQLLPVKVEINGKNIIIKIGVMKILSERVD